MKNSKIIILLIIILAMGVSMLVFLVMRGNPRRANSDSSQGHPIPPPIQNTMVPMPSPAPTTTTQIPAQSQVEQLDSSGRQTYKNTDFGFELKYSKGWKMLKEINSKDASYPIPLWVSFGTGIYGNEGYDGEFFVLVYDKRSVGLEEVIGEYGKQFSDRLEKRQKIMIDGIPALKITITTPSNPSWILEETVIEHGGYIYLVGNGAVENALFNDFYNSFKFLKIM